MPNVADRFVNKQQISHLLVFLLRVVPTETTCPDLMSRDSRADQFVQLPEIASTQWQGKGPFTVDLVTVALQGQRYT